MFRSVGALLLVFLSYFSPSQNLITDSLENALNERLTVNEEYIDLLNALSFEYLKSDPSKGIELVNKAKDLAGSIDYEKGLFRATVNKGSGFWISGLPDLALYYYLEALTLNVEDNYVNLAKVNNNIGEVFKKKNQYDSALKYYHTAWWIAQNKIPDRYPSILASNIAELHFLMNNMDSAERYYSKSYDFALLDENDRGMAYALYGMAEIEYRKGGLQQSIVIHENALALRQNIKDVRGEVQSLLKLGSYHNELGQRDRSIDFYDQAELLSKKIKAYDLLNDSYSSKSQYYSSIGDYRVANHYLLRYQSLKDSLGRETFVNSIVKIQEALNAELRETENKLLREQQITEKQSGRIKSIVILSVSFLVLILSAFLFQYNRWLKQASRNSDELNSLNKIITRKNREIEEINEQLDTQLSTTNKMLIESQIITKLGSWEYNFRTGRMNWTDETFRQFGLDTNSMVPSVEIIKRKLRPEEFKKIIETFQEVESKGEPATVEVEVPDEKGNIQYFSIKMVPEFNDGELVRIYGSNLDRTKKVLLERKEKSIISSLLRLSKSANLKDHDFEEFIEYLLKETTGILGVEKASFWSYDADEKAIHCVKKFDGSISGYTSGEKEYEDNYPNYFNELFNNRTVAVDNVFEDNRNFEFRSEYLKKHQIRSILDAPVYIDNKLTGVISFVKTDTPVQWTYSDQRFAGSLADIISTAYSTSQNKKLEREKGILIEQLLKKNQNLQEFANVISHNLRSPVTQIMGLSKVYDEIDSQSLQQEIIHRINNATVDLDNVIKDLSLVLNHQDGNGQSKQDFRLFDCVLEIKRDLQEQIDKVSANINLDFDEDFVIFSNRSYVRNILFHLLSNSLKYNNPDVPLEIELSAGKTAEHFNLVFSDNGQGIDLKQFDDKIFKMYQRFHLDVEGRGIGLYIVKNQVENLGGNISVSSEPGKGTVFTIELPARTEHHTLITSVLS